MNIAQTRYWLCNLSTPVMMVYPAGIDISYCQGQYRVDDVTENDMRSGNILKHSMTMLLHKHHGFSNHWQLHSLFKSLFSRTTKKIFDVCITGLAWGESTSDHWSSVDPPHKNVFPCHHVEKSCHLTHWGLVMPFGDIDLGQHWLR